MHKFPFHRSSRFLGRSIKTVSVFAKRLQDFPLTHISSILLLSVCVCFFLVFVSLLLALDVRLKNGLKGRIPMSCIHADGIFCTLLPFFNIVTLPSSLEEGRKLWGCRVDCIRIIWLPGHYKNLEWSNDLTVKCNSVWYFWIALKHPDIISLLQIIFCKI